MVRGIAYSRPRYPYIRSRKEQFNEFNSEIPHLRF